MSAALYRGLVRHTRLRPQRHALRYSIFMVLADLQRLEDAARGLRLFSLERFNLFSLYTRDHGDGSTAPLREQIAAHLQHGGIAWDGGPIRMLFMPRMLGYAFNPLTVYYCHRRDESLAAIVYEVHNTFGERHSYLLAVNSGGKIVHQDAQKCFYVSPFMDMAMRYRFTLAVPDAHLQLAIAGDDADGPLIATSFNATRSAFSDGNLLRACASAPLLGLKVIAGIYWEAFKLWRKGIALRRRPAPPAEAVSFAPDPQPVLHSPEALHPAG